MTKPVRIQLSRKKGFDLQALSSATNGLPAINCARPGRWSNPFRVLPSKSLGWWDVVGEHFIAGQCSLSSERGARAAAVAFFEAHTPIGRTVSTYPLRGRNLACWCPLPSDGEPDCCHAAILLRLANPDSIPVPKMENVT